jgi:hypothetical protein
MDIVMVSEVSSAVEVSLLVFLFIFQVYFLGKLFSCADAELLRKYRLLGPFALAVPGVLEPGGAKFLLAFLAVSAALFLFILYIFQFSEPVLS